MFHFHDSDLHRDFKEVRWIRSFPLIAPHSLALQIEVELGQGLNLDNFKIYRILTEMPAPLDLVKIPCLESFMELKGHERSQIIDYFMMKVKLIILIDLGEKENWPSNVYQRIRDIFIANPCAKEDELGTEDEAYFFLERVLDNFYKVCNTFPVYLP